MVYPTHLSLSMSLYSVISPLTSQAQAATKSRLSVLEIKPKVSYGLGWIPIQQIRILINILNILL